MTSAFLALGSNLGDRSATLQFAKDKLQSTDGLMIRAVTSTDETIPLGGLDQPLYLNAMLSVLWSGTATELLEQCHKIEGMAGRTRTQQWQSRVLDIDLVRFGDQLCDTPELTLPHPGLRDRIFWAKQMAKLENNA